MGTVGAFEAKTHLSDLLDRVSKGETITITGHGIPTAKLVPVGLKIGGAIPSNLGTVSQNEKWGEIA